MVQAHGVELICSVAPRRSQITWAHYFLADPILRIRKSKWSQCWGKAQLCTTLSRATTSAQRLSEVSKSKLLQNAYGRLAGPGQEGLTTHSFKPQTAAASNKPQSTTWARTGKVRPFVKHLCLTACVSLLVLSLLEPWPSPYGHAQTTTSFLSLKATHFWTCHSHSIAGFKVKMNQKS